MIATSVSKPGGRSHSGGMPWRATIAREVRVAVTERRNGMASVAVSSGAASSGAASNDRHSTISGSINRRPMRRP